MNSDAPTYHGYRFPSAIIGHTVWLYYRFSLSFRDVEDLLAQRSVTVTYETIRQWCYTFGQAYARRLRHRRGQQGDTWYLDELFVSLNGRTIKESCLERVVLTGEGSLRHSVREFIEHDHHERTHQGLGNHLIHPPSTAPPSRSPVQCRQRLGGMLNYYYRAAA